MSYIEKSEWQWNDIYDETNRYNLNNSESMNSVAKCNEIIDKCAEKAVTTGNHVDFANFYIK